jgi:hypothetical protein
LAALFALDQPGFVQHPQVMRYRRESQAELLRDSSHVVGTDRVGCIGGDGLLLAELLKDRQAMFIGKGFEVLAGIHATLSICNHFDISKTIVMQSQGRVD